MCRKHYGFVVLVSCFLAGGLYADVIQSQWIGNDGDAWDNPGNWNPHWVPDNLSSRQFEVTIETVERTRVRINRSAITINKLDCYGNIDIEKPDDSGNFQFILADGIGVTNYGELTFSGDFWEIIGNLTNTNSGFLKVSDYTELFGDIVNDGRIMINPLTQFAIADGSMVNNGVLFLASCHLGVSKELINNNLITGAGVISCNTTFINNQEGVIEALSGTLHVYTDVFSHLGVIRNKPNASMYLQILRKEGFEARGTIEVHSGGGITSSEAFSCDPNSRMHLYGGTLAAPEIKINAQAEFSGFGTITANTTVNSGGLLGITGPSQIVGDLSVQDNAIMAIQDGQLLVTGHTFCDGTIQFTDAKLKPQGGYSGDFHLPQQ